MTDSIDQMIDAAEQAGNERLSSEPQARQVRYDRKSGRVIVELTNGCSFAFPAHLAEGLADADARALSSVEILGAGYGLRWDTLDVDLSLPGLMAGVLGTRAYMDRMRAARAGSATSKAKALAARRNGRKGGRPRKAAR